MSSYVDKSKKKLAPRAPVRRPVPPTRDSQAPLPTPPPTQSAAAGVEQASQADEPDPEITNDTADAASARTETSNRQQEVITQDWDSVPNEANGPATVDDNHDDSERPAKRLRKGRSAVVSRQETTNTPVETSDASEHDVARGDSQQEPSRTLAQVLQDQQNAESQHNAQTRSDRRTQPLEDRDAGVQDQEASQPADANVETARRPTQEAEPQRTRGRKKPMPKPKATPRKSQAKAAEPLSQPETTSQVADETPVDPAIVESQTDSGEHNQQTAESQPNQDQEQAERDLASALTEANSQTEAPAPSPVAGTGRTVKSRAPRKRKQAPTQASGETDPLDDATEEGQQESAAPPRKRTRRQPQTEQEGPNDGTPNDAANGEQSTALTKQTKRKRKTTKKAPPRSASEINDKDAPQIGDGANADEAAIPTPAASPEEAVDVPRKTDRRRAETPESAEEHEIDPSKMTMMDLCSDRKRGKKSKLEREMQSIDWEEVARRRKEADAKARAAGQNASRTEARRQLDEAGNRDQGHTQGPQLEIGPDGEIVLDTTSLVVNRHAAPDETQPAIEVNDLTKRVNAHSWLYDNKRDPADRFYTPSGKWSQEETDVFYGALKMFGTDFDMISKMFPGRNRRMIKLKFTREEREHEWRIRAVLLGQPDPINFENYCKFSGQNPEDFKDPEVFAEELKEEKERQEVELQQEAEEQREHQRKKQEAAERKAEAAARRRTGEKVPRKRRSKKDKAAAAAFEASGGTVEIVGEPAAATDGADAGGEQVAAGAKPKKTRGKQKAAPGSARKPRGKKAAAAAKEAEAGGQAAADGEANAAEDAPVESIEVE